MEINGLNALSTPSIIDELVEVNAWKRQTSSSFKQANLTAHEKNNNIGKD